MRPLPLWLLALVICGISSATLAQTPLIQPFSTMTALSDGWQPLTFPNIDQHSHYELVKVDGQQVVKATADNSASGLIARLTLEPAEKVILRWRWKVSNVYDRGDARQRSGDDYPARVYVLFEPQPKTAGLLERAKRSVAERVYGETLPGNALSYIWANRVPAGTVLANAFSDRSMLIAVNSGADDTGQWVSVERDIVADYRQAFGTDPPSIVGIAIMSDADNTGERAEAWYQDIELLLPSE